MGSAASLAICSAVIDYLDVVRCSQYRNAFSSAKNNLDEIRLRDICSDKENLNIFLTDVIGVKDETDRGLISSMLRNLNIKSCLHLCVEKLDGHYFCNQCFKYFCHDSSSFENLRDLTREAREKEIEASIIPDFIPSNVNSEELRSDYVGKLSQGRGVPIGWLVDFTYNNDCWDMTTQDVCRKFIYPATAARRCRYVELDGMQSITGPASTFISHCRGGTWGDLVAAVCDGDVDRSRRVWIDIFACRQWPSSHPDLDFTSTIRNCSSFLLVSSSLEEIKDVDASKSLTRESNVFPKHVRSKIAFFRVWCLAEIHTASECKDMPIIIKGGKLRKAESTRSKDSFKFKFEQSRSMLTNMAFVIDFKNADSTVAQDKAMILDLFRRGGVSKGDGDDGIENINIKISRIITSTVNFLADTDATILQNAAYGDSKPLALVIADPLKYFQSMCAGGYVGLLRKIVKRNHVEELKKSSKLNKALHSACEGANIDLVRFLVEINADINAKTEDNDGTTPLQAACRGANIDIARLLIDNNADVNPKPENGND